MTERDPTDEEEREAEALATALERGHAREELPEDALETAALLRYSRDGGALPEARRAAILDEVWASARPRPERGQARAPLGWLKWLIPAGGLAAAAGAALLLITAGRDLAPVAEVAEPAALPAPGPDLLRAQAAAAGGEAEGRRALEREMRAYRGALLASLEPGHGGR